MSSRQAPHKESCIAELEGIDDISDFETFLLLLLEEAPVWVSRGGCLSTGNAPLEQTAL